MSTTRRPAAEPAPAGELASAGEPERLCLDRAIDYLLSLQSEDGWWKGELETNVTIDAEDLLLRQFLGIRTARETEATARWIRSRQREDGSFATFFGGPPDVSTTVEAYLALRLAGDRPEAEHMAMAAQFVRESGGIAATRVFTRIWLALFGLWPWERLPVMPPELIFLPPSVPLNIYDFACWARQTVVALTIVSAHRPVRPIDVTLDELACPPLRGSENKSNKAVSLRTWGGRFELADRFLHIYQRRPLRRLRRAALSRAERWVVKRQEADGSWGGIQPPWVYSLIALSLQGYPLDHPVMSAALRGLDSFTVEDEQGRRLEACQSPVWDTALAVIALRDAGLEASDRRLRVADAWLLREEITVKGDWSVRRPDLAPGGWAFEFANDNYPDIDDTAEVVLALERMARLPAGQTPRRQSGQKAEPLHDPAIARAVEWVLGMQCDDGGWGAFDVESRRELCRQLPFCDFGELIDPPSADVTAHVVEMLAELGAGSVPHLAQAMRRGVDWLLDNQERDGSWFGRWGANHVYGTGAVVPALVAAGVPVSDPSVKRAVTWLAEHQNADGGWGEDLRSYREPAWIGRGCSTPSQTAWALLALLAAGCEASEGLPLARGISYLVETQRPDGGWDEPYFTGTGFPGDFYINYHLYRLVFPITALGRYIRRHGALVGLGTHVKGEGDV